MNASEYPGQRPEWELELSQRWHHDPNLRRRDDDYPVEVSDAEILPQMFAGVGGSTLHFGGHFPRLLPSDFRVRTLDGVGDDWPISYADLLPVLRAHRSRSRRRRARRRPGAAARRAAAAAAAPDQRLRAEGGGGHERARLALVAGAERDRLARLGNLQRCARYGTCETGCPHGAKASVDLTHWPEAIRHGARLVTGARVREITVDAPGRARGADLPRPRRRRAPPGAPTSSCSPRTASARRGCCCCRPRRSIRDGLANSSGLVGQAADAASDRRRRRRATTTTSRPGRARPASRSTRSSSTTPTPTAASCAARSGR